MAIFDYLKLARLFVLYGLPFVVKLIGQRIRAASHLKSYKATPSPKNVVVIGGSFAGSSLAKRLCESLPTGYRVVLIEKNSHFNFTFVFPRYSVAPGYESKAFIPYEFVDLKAPEGIYLHLRDVATEITAHEVRLASGKTIPYAYLAIATGSSAAPPTKLKSPEKAGACAELRDAQDSIRAAHRICVVGGGAVGIELVTDIQSWYPEKDVTLVHSRDQLLPAFGRRLHQHVVDICEKLGIKVVLGQRPKITASKGAARPDTLTFPDGKVKKFDLVLPCLGNHPNSQVIRDFAPESVSKETDRILVKPTLQVQNGDAVFDNIFALGDVSETGGPKMARASMFQSFVVADNIQAMIKGQNASNEYNPQSEIEGAIHLTLGKGDHVMYSMRPDRPSDLLIPAKNEPEDRDIRGVWKGLGLELKDDEHTEEKIAA